MLDMYRIYNPNKTAQLVHLKGHLVQSGVLKVH